MRILLVTPYAPSLERPRSYNFIRRLSRNHSISLVALVQSVREQESVEQISEYCENAQAVFISKSQFYANCLKHLFSRVPLRAASCFSPEAERAIAQLLDRNHYNIIQVEQVRAAHFGANIDELPTVYDSTDSITLLFRKAYRASKHPFWKLLFLEELLKMRSYEPRISAKFDRILMCSAEDRDALIQLDSQLNISIVRNGVDLDYFQPQKDGYEPNSIILSGRWSYYVNSDALMYFLRAIFPFILAKKPKVKLYIVGPNPPKQARELATGDVTITGYVPDIRPYLAQAAVAVCPMRLAVGTQNKIIEAMAIGIPVVSTLPGCTGLEVRAEEHLLVADEPAVFAERVVEVMEDSQLRARLARNGRGYVESHHDWKSIGRQLETIYAQVAGGT